MSSTVIILGAARSGTKFLRDVLGASRVVRVVPHDINYVWRRGNERWPNDALPASRYTDDIGRYVRRRVLALSGARADDGGVIVEKTVSNTLRVDFVRSVYPEARLIHLIRDGRAVVESTLRQWQEKPEWGRLLKKALTLKPSDLRYAFWSASNIAQGRPRSNGAGRVWGPRYEGIERDLAELPLLEVCGRQWTTCVERTLEGLSRVPPELVETVRYEELMRGTEPLERLAAFLEVPDPEAVIQRYHAVRIANADRKWQEAFGPDERARVGRVIEGVMGRLGYAT